MFKQEMYGYSKSEVNKYLSDTLKRLESFERTIEIQREEIKSLEAKIENLKQCDSSSEVIEQAKTNADKIIKEAIINAKALDEKIQNAILHELDKYTK